MPPRGGQPRAQPHRRQMGWASVEKSAGAAILALTFPMGCSPLVGWEEEEQSQDKGHRKETKKEGWCLDEEGRGLAAENTAQVTPEAWNLLTSRGTRGHRLSSQQRLRKGRPTLCKNAL